MKRALLPNTYSRWSAPSTIAVYPNQVRSSQVARPPFADAAWAQKLEEPSVVNSTLGREAK